MKKLILTAVLCSIIYFNTSYVSAENMTIEAVSSHSKNVITEPKLESAADVVKPSSSSNDVDEVKKNSEAANKKSPDSSVENSEIKFSESFLFGLATAPGHAEDQLDDIWTRWGEAGKIRAYLTEDHSEERLQFWTQPEIEINLAAATGIQIYRLGIDWGRVMPRAGEFDEAAIERYKQIIQMIKNKNMKVMFTLMHHSIPTWAQDMDGWHTDKMKKHFLEFSKKMITTFHQDVDYWITFNEANVFTMLSYTAGLWPPGEKTSFLSMLSLGSLYKGSSIKAMDRMSDVHKDVYKWAHAKFPEIKMGIAQNMAYYTSKSWWGKISAWYADRLMNWRFPESIQGYVDFFGFNYYGAEWVKGTVADIYTDEEYSEAGRAVYPKGLYLLLQKIHQKFSQLPIFITENGVADVTDKIRPAYMIEHLAAIYQAQTEGIPVMGYIFWTLTDNMEWADGYCPKFGLVAVDRKDNLKRIPRESYKLFSDIVKSKAVTNEQRTAAWTALQDYKQQGHKRYFCRADDGINALDYPVERNFSNKDWRFSLGK